MLWVFQLHAGLAEVAAAKARMFVNKPDGSMYFYLLLIYLEGLAFHCKIVHVEARQMPPCN